MYGTIMFVFFLVMFFFLFKALIIDAWEMKFMSTALLGDLFQDVVCALEAITESGIRKMGVRQTPCYKEVAGHT